MFTDEIIKTIILQIPAVGILLAFTVSLYRDMRNDAERAFKQREESIDAIRKLAESIDRLLVTIKVTKE